MKKVNNWELFKEYCPKELFYKVGHIDLKTLKGAAKTYCEVELSESEYASLCETIQRIEAYWSKLKYES